MPICEIRGQKISSSANQNGHRTQNRELSCRIINNTFDKLHRLTAEKIERGTGVPPVSFNSALGTLSYSYDAVGNRNNRTTTGSATLSSLLPNQTQSFTPNDRLTSDTYDANGNTTSSSSPITSNQSPLTNVIDVYSFDNKLIRRTTPDGKTIDLTYNPDGHRLAKLIVQGGLTQRLHHYLTDANNPTSYAQVIEEKDPFAPTAEQLKKVHLYGHDLISSSVYQPSTLNHQLLFYSYDGLGSVRSLSNEFGDLQETYDYDAYGTLIGLAKRNPTSGDLESVDPNSPDSALRTPTSEFLFTGEQFDSDLEMYFIRARYLNTNTGRFHSQDTYEGRNSEPLSLHKYLYANGNPAMMTDSTGNFSLSEAAIVQNGITALSNLNFRYTSAVGAGLFNSLVQARLLVLGGPLVYELDDLARTVQQVNPRGAGKIIALNNRIKNAISAPTVFFNVYFPAFLASFPGKYGVGSSIAFSLYRFIKLGTFFEDIVAKAAEGASFDNGRSHLKVTASIHPWSSAYHAFGAFGLGGTGMTPALDVLHLNLGIQSLLSFDIGGGAYWLSEFHRGVSTYSLDVSGEFGGVGKNYRFGGKFFYQQ